MGILERGQVKQLVTAHAKRLGIDTEKALANAWAFADTVGLIESDGNLKAKNVPQEGEEATSAKGLYQFVDGSISPAVNRASKYIKDAPWMKLLEEGRIDITDLDKEQQTLLFLADVLEKTAVVNGKKVPKLGDEIMRKVLSEGKGAQQALAYEILHHTNVDEATKRRMGKYFKDQGAGDGTKDSNSRKG